MKLFLSHAASEYYLAQTVRLRLEELSDEIECFLHADDVIAGDDWEARIRTAAGECDGLVSLVTRNYIERPWFVAEWAAFWFQDKPWYLLLRGVTPDSVFEPMRRRQAFSLDDRRSVERFLSSLTVNSARSGPVDLLANEVVKAVTSAEREHAAGRVQTNLSRLAESLKRGTDNVDRAIVKELERSGHLPQAIELAHQTDNSVALRQLASILIELDRLDEVSIVVKRIPNNAERRTVALATMDHLGKDPQNAAAKALLLDIYSLVRQPQRRDLWDAATERHLDVEWPDLPDNP